MTWRATDPQGNEVGKIRWELVPYTRGKGLDLGCGPDKGFPHFTGVDNLKDTELFGIQMKPDVVVETCEELVGFKSESQDFVFSSHLLEHIEDYRAALKEWWRVIKPGGYLVLYLPHRNEYPNCGTEGANPDHKHDFTESHIEEAMKPLGGWSLIRNELRNEGMEYSFFQVWQKRSDKRQTYPCDIPKSKTKTACVVRYGGFGDMIQASGIFPLLKDEGYHVVLMTTERGKSVVEHDPNIDEFYIQDENQVPNGALTVFWEYMAPKYDKFINLSESIEGTLLALPGRANHGWPFAMRHKYMNLNYHEFTAEVAGVKFKPVGGFYPTAYEESQASAMTDNKAFTVMYALSGSSQHKFYAGMDAVIAQLLLKIPDITIFMVGDAACKILECGWEKEERVVLLSGEQTIRETLALAQKVDCVIGPETGVLNAVGFCADVAKVCLLSHSSIENLAKHWVHSYAIEPVGMACYPCHRLHYGMRFCFEDEETGTALCQRSILPDRVVDAVMDAFAQWKVLAHELA